MIPAILTKIGLPVLIDLVSGALRRVEHPSAQSASQALDNVQSALASGLITDSQMAEANRHAEAMAHLKQKEFEVSLSEINQSLRSEVASNDPYVRRMRPTFGYLMALTWAAQMFGLAYVVVFETDQAARVLEGMASLSSIWAVALSVLGIYVYKRSEEKKSTLPFLRSETPESKSKRPPVPPPKPQVRSNINP
ncbi:MAG: ribokinase [Alphaproteobacteria bacterium]|nr:ribokinase [Alphaproteobacteria bacterium]